jgi:hypothetical protein
VAASRERVGRVGRLGVLIESHVCDHEIGASPRLVLFRLGAVLVGSVESVFEGGVDRQFAGQGTQDRSCRPTMVRFAWCEYNTYFRSRRVMVVSPVHA